MQNTITPYIPYAIKNQSCEEKKNPSILIKIFCEAAY